MAVARESLSPLMRNVQARRFSLELCQKIGNHILFPPGLCPSPTPTSSHKNQSPGNDAPMNWSPANSHASLLHSIVNNNTSSAVTASPNNITIHQSRRRGSADQDVLKSLSPMLLCGGGGSRRRSSLTPLQTTSHHSYGGKREADDEENNNHHNHCRSNAQQALCQQQYQHQHHMPYQIPSINIQDSPNYRSKGAKKCEVTFSTPKRGTHDYVDTSGLFGNVSPFSGEAVAYDCDSRSGPKNSVESARSNVLADKRRKSSASRYDFDEDFMQFVASKWNLKLFPENELGRGSFGTVIHGVYYGGNVAVKIIRTKFASHLESMKGEQNALLLQHPHLARVIDIFQMGPERALVVMELLKKGNLLQVLNDGDILLDSSIKIRIAGQIASALHYCHQQGVLHLDVKPQNVLIDQNDNCKLADFGTSKQINDFAFVSKLNKLEGTVVYKAPELFKGSIPTIKCDVYSFGICMWQILYRDEPYRGLEEHSVIYQVVAHGLRPRISPNNDYTNFDTSCHSLRNYIHTYENCWHAEPNVRPDMKTVVEKLLLLLYNV